MYSWISRVVLASNAQMSAAARTARMTHAVGEHQPVAAAGELAGHEPVLAEDGGQDREPVERRVRRQHQDRGGEGLHREEADRVVPEDGRAASWAMTVRWV